MPHPHQTVILGAGLAGLSCAYHHGPGYQLLEKEGKPGGVARTQTIETPAGPFLCDGTGHWLHLRDNAMRTLVNQLMEDNLVQYERRAFIHLKGTLTPYPFQANTHGLPPEVILDCLLGLCKTKYPEDFGLPPHKGRPQHFRHSIERFLGEGICKHFMIPYNEKLLGVPLEEISPEYAERFIPQPSLEDALKGAFGFSREALGYNARFLYPRQGGIAALPEALASALPCPPRYNTRVEHVDLHAKRVTLKDGTSLPYEHLVNTAPLPRFLSLLSQIPAEVAEAASRLRSTTVYYFDIGIRGEGGPSSTNHWTYFPEPDFLFYRVGSYSAVHAAAAPRGCKSFYVEMSGGIPALLNDEQNLARLVLADMRKAGLLTSDDEILFAERREIPHAYVLHDNNYIEARQTILNYLASAGVQSIGRWGGWNYGGMEDAMLEGKQAALSIQRCSELIVHDES